MGRARSRNPLDPTGDQAGLRTGRGVDAARRCEFGRISAW